MTLQLSSLDAIEAAVWIELSRAARDKSHAWRTPVLATIAGESDGELRADARTIVLREVREEDRALVFFTDARSHKVDQLKVRPAGTLVMWSPALSWQLRCAVHLRAVDDTPEVATLWERIAKSAAAQDYLSAQAPGSVLDGISPAQHRDAHFAIVTATVIAIDWLEIDRHGHRRARFDAGRRDWRQP